HLSSLIPVFATAPAAPDTYPLSLHDALPISVAPRDADPVDPVGVSVYPLRTVATWDQATGVKVSPTGKKFKLATTQDKHPMDDRSEEHTSELQSRENLVCRLLLEKKKQRAIL